jgi:rfaE bifunctional protein kinase chain/domain
LYGTTRRISREAPVLILSYRNKEFCLGGAGNSLLNLKALGANPLPIGVIGSDPEGDSIIQILETQEISRESLQVAEGLSTPVKMRVLAGEETTRKQQILRIDKEGTIPDTPRIQENMKKALDLARKTIQALLISDYNYFTVTEAMYSQIQPEFKTAQIPIALDSRFRILGFKGTTVATPNEPEVESALQMEICRDDNLAAKAGETLLELTESEALLLTRGSKGMILFQPGEMPFSIPIQGPADIVDVTGAGDTVISVFTLALAAGADFKEAAQLANYAGGIVVMKKGTATVSPRELKEAIQA